MHVFLQRQVAASLKRKRTPLKSVHRCPYCLCAFYERSPLFRHISKFHLKQVQKEPDGTFGTGKRVYHLQRSGVRKIDPWRVKVHLKRLPWDLDTDQLKELNDVVRDILLEGLVVVGKETDVPETSYMEVKKAMARLR